MNDSRTLCGITVILQRPALNTAFVPQADSTEKDVEKYMNEKNVTCFFTGHRTIPAYDRQMLIGRLDMCIMSLAERGYERFVCGGAMGFDTLAACRVIAIKQRFPQIRLTLVLPCRDQTMKWNDTNAIALYQKIKGCADEVIYSSEVYTSGCMHLRNRTMADMSSVCVAYYNGSSRGGTAYTVKYAGGLGLETINLWQAEGEK